MMFAPINFVVPGLIAEGLTLFAGKPKIGKSWLLMHRRRRARPDQAMDWQSQAPAADHHRHPEDGADAGARLFGKEQWPPGLHFACAADSVLPPAATARAA